MKINGPLFQCSATLRSLRPALLHRHSFYNFIDKKAGLCGWMKASLRILKTFQDCDGDNLVWVDQHQHQQLLPRQTLPRPPPARGLKSFKRSGSLPELDNIQNNNNFRRKCIFVASVLRTREKNRVRENVVCCEIERMCFFRSCCESRWKLFRRQARTRTSCATCLVRDSSHLACMNQLTVSAIKFERLKWFQAKKSCCENAARRKFLFSPF